MGWSKVLSLTINEDMLAKLNEIYIDVRYPAGMGLLPDGIPTVEEARDSLQE